MEIIIYVVSGALVGIFIGWFAADAQTELAVQVEKDAAAKRFSALDKEFADYRATINTTLETTIESLNEKSLEINVLKDSSHILASNLLSLNNELSAAKADLERAMQTIEDKNVQMLAIQEELKDLKNQDTESNQSLATANADIKSLNERDSEFDKTREELKNTKSGFLATESLN